jgi:hypothetical protein
MAPVLPRIIYVSATALRTMFNLGPLPEMISQGDLAPKFLRDSHLRHPEERGERPCTRAQTIRYSDRNGNWRVETFHYQRVDGSIGASGQRDPKRVNEGDTVLVVKPMMTP